jgi:ASC-1-like (ASCH) protein
MTVLKLDIQARYFDAILTGLKTVEGRLAKPNYLALKPKQIIAFMDPTGRSCKAEVFKVIYFKDFKAMLEASNLEKCIPENTSIDEAVEIYRSFPGYRDQEKILGVVAIHIKLR